MGRLVVAAAPIGNVGDVTERLKDAIRNAKFVAAEDSRKFARLCRDLGIENRAKVISFFEGNERERLEELERALIENDSVLLITDSGMPGVSDPGYRAINLALQKGFPIQVLPGASAVTTALVLSGLPTDRFAFEGFLPRTDVARDRALEELAEEERTMIFFEAPHRVNAFLKSAEKAMGGTRHGAICRELTKTYEEVQRGTLTELSIWSNSKEMLGEFTIVIEGFSKRDVSHSEDEIAGLVKRLERAGISRKEAISTVAKDLGIPKRNVFDIMVSHK
ncbi:MAG: 16S rRNA (cytidine(1402)-2'-O)-methyltransferase [Actinobacteria bacterium]|nr:16S rRNA (cytidine(1402)-2'-O)-methyltransferase [Actinomycetota bacterium]